MAYNNSSFNDVVKGLTHEDPDRHLIGESLPAPKSPPLSGGAAAVGESPFPARADHVHAPYYGPTSVSIGTIASASGHLPLYRNSSTGAIVVLSSREELKAYIDDLPVGIINGLRPVKFKPKEGGPWQYGFIAQEVAQIDTSLGVFNEKGEPIFYNEQGLLAVAVAEIQNLKERVRYLESKLAL